MHEAGRIDFVGNIEGKELFINKCDVVVCDGFAGNIALKVTEGTASMLLKMISTEFKSDLVGCIIGLLAKPFLRRILKKSIGKYLAECCYLVLRAFRLLLTDVAHLMQ